MLNFERIECLEGTWTPMLAIGEDHFIGQIRHTVYTPGIYGYTTSVLKIIHMALPRPYYIATAGPSEIIDISSDSSSEGEDEDDADSDYVPSESSLSSMSIDDSDDSGYTDSAAGSLSPVYEPESDPSEEMAPVEEVSAAAAPEPEVIIIESSSEEGYDSDDSVMIISDPDSDDLF